MIDLANHIGPGTEIWWGQGGAVPTPLVHTLLDQMDRLGPVRAFSGLTWDRRLTTQLPEQLTLVSYGGLGDLRALSRTGRLDIVPCHYSALPRLFAERRLPCDVGFVQVSPPDHTGTCSLGVGADYAADAIPHTPILVAEINERMPNTSGAPRVPLSRFAATISTDRALAEAPERPPDEIERVIARRVAELVDDGDTIQIGIGPLPSGVLSALSGHRDLGFHSGIVTTGVLSLIEREVLTGARKEIDPGIVVAGSALGSTELYERLPQLPIELRATSYTHAPATLSRLESLVAINSAIEVDLTGQVGAEIRRGAYIGAVGGQVDFSRAAALTGARSIIALRSTSGGESTIVPALRGGVVTTARSDVDVVVTEHGVAWLRGCTPADRAYRLISVAAPEHRESLERSVAARKNSQTVPTKNLLGVGTSSTV